MLNRNAVIVGSLLLVAIVLATVGCSKSPNEPGNDQPGPQIQIPPLAPDSLKATRIGDKSISLSWKDMSNNESGFTVVRRSIPGAAKDSVVLDTVPANTEVYSDQTVEVGKTYRYWIGAYNGAGKTVSATTDILVSAILEALGAPTELTGKVTSDKLIVSWNDNASKETGFELHMQEDPRTGRRVDTVALPANTTTYELNAPKSGVFTIKVRAFNRAAFSGFSNELMIDFSVTAPPVAPGDLRVEVRGEEVTLRWTDNSSSETGFVKEVATDAAFTNIVYAITNGANRESYVWDWTGVANDTYYFRVGATNQYGTHYSNVLQHQVPFENRPDFTVQKVAPAEWPSIISAGGQFTLKGWTIANSGSSDAVTNVGLYFWPIVRFFSPSDIVYEERSITIRAGQSYNLNYINFKVPQGTDDGDYRLMVAIDIDGNVDEIDEGNNAAWVDFRVDTPQLPDLVVEPDASDGFIVLPRKADAGSKVVVARWYASNVGEYATNKVVSAGVYISTDSLITKTDRLLRSVLVPSLPAGIRASISADSVQLPPDLTTGIYYVGALVDYQNELDEVLETNNYLAVDIEIEGIPSLGPPNAPTNLQVQLADRTALLTWQDNAQNEHGFRVTIESENAFAYDTTYTTVANQKSLQINWLKMGRHTVYVRSFNNFGNSVSSNQVTLEVVPGASSGSIRIVNNLHGGQFDKVLRFRVGVDDFSVLNVNQTEMLEPEDYCNIIPGRGIAPGESMTFDISYIGANYTFHIGLGEWDSDLIECTPGFWGKRMFISSSATGFKPWYVYNQLDVQGHTSGTLTFSLEYDSNENVVLTDGTSNFPFVVNTNGDPIHF